jgi:Outer membrane protein beta-barrel domain
MKVIIHNKRYSVKLLLILLLTISPLYIIHAQQRIGFGIHADPSVNWFSTDISQVRYNGARAGFNFGLTYNKYFAPNYSFSTGISLMRTGGRLVSSDTTTMEFSNSRLKVLPGNPVEYKIQYLVIPIGLKLQTNQIGYLTFFSDLGLDPKIAISRKADIPSLNISGENANNEINLFNLSYHITAGIEYSLGGSTALVLGLNFDNNFLDATTDNGNPRTDKVSQKILSFRFGINF